MFKMTHSQLMQADLHKAMNKLMAAPTTTKAIANLLKIRKNMSAAIEDAAEVHKILFAQFTHMDADGKPVPHATPTHLIPYKVIEGKEKECEAKLLEFINTEVEIHGHKLVLEDFSGMKMSANDVLALQAVLQDPAEQAPDASQA